MISSLSVLLLFPPGRPRTSGSNGPSRGEGAKGKYSHSGCTAELCFLSESSLAYILKEFFFSQEISKATTAYQSLNTLFSKLMSKSDEYKTEPLRDVGCKLWQTFLCYKVYLLGPNLAQKVPDSSVL